MPDPDEDYQDCPDHQEERGRRWFRVRRKLEANGQHLARRGSLVARQTASGQAWYVRFQAQGRDGRAVQRSIYIGRDPMVVHKTREWLRELRETGKFMTESARMARVADGIVTSMIRLFAKRG